MRYFVTILSFCLTLGLTVPGFAAEQAPAESSKSFAVGSLQFEMITDKTGDGDTSILRNASPELLNKYIPSGKYPMAITSAIVRDGKRVILIDSGLGLQLKKHLRNREIDIADVEAVLLTHMHFDHIDGLMFEGAPVFPKAKIYIAENEIAYWKDNENIKKFPKEQSQVMTAYFEKSQAVLAAYSDRIVPFTPGELGANGTTLLPGINSLAAYGHTPGHTAFLLNDQEKKLLVAGDAFHVSVIQFPRPEVTIVYDVDQEQAAKTRKALFSYAATNGIPITGMHKAAPEIGLLKPHPQEKDGYIFEPVQ